MTGKERLEAAIRGKKVDRAPIWLREGFEIIDPLPPESDFRNGWKQDKIYKEFCDWASPHVDIIKGWSWGAGYFNRFLGIPPCYDIRNKPEIKGDEMIIGGYINTPDGRLSYEQHWKHQSNNSWMTPHPVNSVEELKRVARIPFELDREAIKASAQNYKKALLSDRKSVV